jgi:cytochrome c oxidase assembly protein subunit 15
MKNNRSIFEDVDTNKKQFLTGGVIDQGRGGARYSICIWLLMLFFLVIIMIVVGGLTRLTDSGLSITEWRPITGAIPPMSTADWEAEFAKYRNIDEFQLQNRWMDLSDFQVIYWWEWGHRQLGRVIGLVWAIGFFWFLLRGKIPTGWTSKLLLLGVLGGAQGAIGWWMVSSGITSGKGMLDVASYRLALHLGLAFLILGFIFWFILLLRRSERDLMQARREKDAKLFGLSTGLLYFTFLQVLIGALVAGIDAGRSYTDWPLMGGQLFPANSFILSPFWSNFFENPALLQFIHRSTGYLLFAITLFVWLQARKSAMINTRFAFNAMFVGMCFQLVLGILTVVYGAPWQVAILHQLMAIVLWTLILRSRFLSAYPLATAIKGNI